MYVDIELQTVERLVFLGSGVRELDRSRPEEVEVGQVTKEEVLWITSLVASVSETEMRREEVPACVWVRGGGN